MRWVGLGTIEIVNGEWVYALICPAIHTTSARGINWISDTWNINPITDAKIPVPSSAATSFWF